MTIEEVVRKIRHIGIVPVLRASSTDDACRAVDVISEAGIPIVEITMTVPHATTVIREVVRRYGDTVLAGAGTVVDAEQASACLDAGAEFLVSPGLSVPVIQLARSRKKLAIPGALTPTEVMALAEHGMNLMKIFPCSSVGGPQHIASLRAPFPKLDFIPTGGVSASNAEEYLRAGAFALGVGADLVDIHSIRAGQAHKVTSTAQALKAAIAKVRQGHGDG
jgi:2-dehydro-3-deoxyphosphogluconate aldolase / (4S)-4-hydroxy-2-oxoglutarate aldolase